MSTLKLGHGYTLTTDHSASSYGQPVLVDRDGNAIGPGDPITYRRETITGADLAVRLADALIDMPPADRAMLSRYIGAIPPPGRPPLPPTTPFGAAVQEAMHRAGIRSVRALSRASGVSARQLHYYLRDDPRAASAANIAAIERALNLSSGELLRHLIPPDNRA